MDYVAIVDGYFLLGVNPQVFLKIPKNRTELEWCASAFLERIVQTNSLDDYFEEFQVVRAQLEGIAAYMSEELSEIFFLELFIAGMEEETKSYVQWIAPRTVLVARRHAKYHTTEGRRLAQYYQELKRGVEISSAIRDDEEVRGDGTGNHQVEQEEEGLTTHTTCSTKVLEETVHDAAEGEVETEHSNCLIKVLGENMDARLQLSTTPPHLAMVNSYVQSNITIAYGIMCKILETVGCYQFLEMLMMFKALARSGMNKRLDGVDETRNDTLAYCIQLENSEFWPGSLCDLSKLLWDPGGIWKITELTWWNDSQENLEIAKCLSNFSVGLEPILKSCRHIKLRLANHLIEVQLIMIVDLLQQVDVILNEGILLNLQFEDIIWVWTSSWAEMELKVIVQVFRQNILSEFMNFRLLHKQQCALEAGRTFNLMFDPGGDTNSMDAEEDHLEGGALGVGCRFSIKLWDPGGKLKCTKGTSGVVGIKLNHEEYRSQEIESSKWVLTAVWWLCEILGYHSGQSSFSPEYLDTCNIKGCSPRTEIFGWCSGSLDLCSGSLGLCSGSLVLCISSFGLVQRQLCLLAAAACAATTCGSLSSGGLSSISQRLATSGLIRTARSI